MNGYDELDAFTPIEIKKANDIFTPIPHGTGAEIIERLRSHGAEVTAMTAPYAVEDPESVESTKVVEYKIHFPEKTRKEVGFLSSRDVQASTIVFPDGFHLRLREHTATGRAILYLPKTD